ncbi:HNH endonuclease [Pseudobythopirellula maris]|uniref:HNH endonuclease n=1 Tax=Pseudobythopirellula maris TaxID=2527991 RepID=UPI0011B4B299|nr:HNH endonuclease [Pseudobythopirellula maris]
MSASDTAGLKVTLYKRCLRDMDDNGIAASGSNAIICPLCWKEARLDELTIEHVIPGSVGGTLKTLTCKKCNNDQGSRIDSHLSNYMRTQDRFSGNKPMKAKMTVAGYPTSVDIDWLKGRKDIRIIGQATNPKNSLAIQRLFSEGKNPPLEFTIPYGFSDDGIRLAILRCAYLSVLSTSGYSLLINPAMGKIRGRFHDPDLKVPCIRPLTVFVKGMKEEVGDYQHCYCNGHVDRVPFLFVLLFLRTSVTKCVGAFLPMPSDASDTFFELMGQVEKENTSLSIVAASGNWLCFPAALSKNR